MRRKSGFTLIEVAVAAALMAILAAATVPTFVEYLEQRDAESTAKTLASIASGVVTYQTVVRTSGTNATYPRNISYLTNAITTASFNSCGAVYSGVAGGTGTLISTYNTGFPYTNFFIPSTGYQTPLGLIDDQMVRTPATANVGTLAITMTAIDSVDAMRLERYIDGDDGGVAANRTAGTLRIPSFPSAGKASIQYIIPVGARC